MTTTSKMLHEFRTMAAICKQEASKCAGHGLKPKTTLRMRTIVSITHRSTRSKLKT